MKLLYLIKVASAKKWPVLPMRWCMGASWDPQSKNCSRWTKVTKRKHGISPQKISNSQRQTKPVKRNNGKRQHDGTGQFLHLNGNSEGKQVELTNQKVQSSWKIEAQDPTICFLQKINFRSEDTHRLKVKGWKMILHTRGNQNTGVGILQSHEKR